MNRQQRRAAWWLSVVVFLAALSGCSGDETASTPDAEDESMPDDNVYV